MNTPNPLHPQGAFPDYRGRSHIRLAVFTILAIHVVLLGALLLQGCKRTTTEPLMTEQTNVIPPFEPPPVVAQPTNVPAASPSSVYAPPSNVYVPPTPVVPPAPVAPPPTEAEHVVVKNDNFSTLAKKYNTTIKAISEANPGVDSTRLKIGQKLRIPAGAAPAPATPAAGLGALAEGAETIYTVKNNDTLTKLAKAHGTTVPALRKANHLRTDQIRVGQKLKIPGKAPAAAPAPAPESSFPAAAPTAPPPAAPPPLIIPTATPGPGTNP
jgi:LysM repeat protein